MRRKWASGVREDTMTISAFKLPVSLGVDVLPKALAVSRTVFIVVYIFFFKVKARKERIDGANH